MYHPIIKWLLLDVYTGWNSSKSRTSETALCDILDWSVALPQEGRKDPTERHPSHPPSKTLWPRSGMLRLRFVRLEGRDKSTGSSVTPVITVDETLKLPEGRVGRSHRGLLHNQYLTFTVYLSITASPLLIVSLQNSLLIGYCLYIWFQTKSRITFTSNCHLQKMTWEKGQTFCIKHYIYLTPTLRTSALR